MTSEQVKGHTPGRCRDCTLYDLQAVLSKNGRVLKDMAARCLWESTEVFPASVFAHNSPRPKPSYMEPNDGAGCPCFISRTGAA
jgi:hypothetical protein